MKLNILYILVFVMFTNMTAQQSLDELLQRYNTRSVPYISVEGLRMLQLNESVVILDAREKEEFEVSHIANSKLVGFTSFSSEEITAQIDDKTTPIVVYCSLGIRSEEIGEKLQKAGFINVNNLYGGIFEWKNNEYPVIDSEGKETEKVHTCSASWSKWLTKGEKVND